MKIENPFTNQEIKNYLLFYASVLVIIILFFIATTLFHNVTVEKRKKFTTQLGKESLAKILKEKEKKEPIRFKLLEISY